jgi:hypothetical protein
MNTYSSHNEGHGTVVAEHAPECRPAPKWAVVLGDRLFPMPRRKLAARDILDQTGFGKEFVLLRDSERPDDVVSKDDTLVDLAEGNVFRATLRDESVPPHRQIVTPKLAFICDDAWEVTLVPGQTGHSLKRLLGLPDDAELFRDFESPHDERIRNDESVLFEDGPVFTVRGLTISVKINNQIVRFTKRRVTGLGIKETAIQQGVKIEVGFVLYRLKADGNLGPAIRDDEHVVLKSCDAFNCVAPDDNS